MNGVPQVHFETHFQPLDGNNVAPPETIEVNLPPLFVIP